MTFKPLLAGKADLLALDYPIAVTPKIDGIRCLIIDGMPVSRTLKPIRNKRIRQALAGLPSILDGELVADNGNFQDSTSAVMAADSTIPWKYCIFDYLHKGKTDESYASRIRQLQEVFATESFPLECELLLPDYIYTLDDLQEAHHKHIAEGFEGSMVRTPKGPYKCGRSTQRESILLKLKEFDDTEAVIVGFEELLHNDNEAQVNALGHTERSTHKENKRESGMLGAFVVHPIGEPELTYRVGTGLTQDQRKQFWQQQDQLLGQLVKVKYFSQGIKNVPRFPVWLGFRSTDDL